MIPEPITASGIMPAPITIPTARDQNRKTISMGSLIAVRKRTMERAPTIPGFVLNIYHHTYPNLRHAPYLEKACCRMPFVWIRSWIISGKNASYLTSKIISCGLSVALISATSFFKNSCVKRLVRTRESKVIRIGYVVFQFVPVTILFIHSCLLIDQYFLSPFFCFSS